MQTLPRAGGAGRGAPSQLWVCVRRPADRRTDAVTGG
jgi:hypothetical protein